jgi:predicted nucleic acid-binding protein
LNCARQSEIIEIRSSITACRDPDDNMFLNLAIDGKADVILTRDPDLLILHPFNNIPILYPAAFMSWMNKLLTFFIIS